MSRKIQTDILKWYGRNRRSLPWRRESPDPYHVWLSEIMLQQTTVPAVIPYFLKFTARWPTVQDLAKAELDDVLTEWAGLGYYARARNLHKCARLVSGNYGGLFPTEAAELQNLPGIGPYTAAAIAAIAFHKPAVPVDGNIERVTARLFAVEDPVPAAKKDIHEKARALGRGCVHPGDFAQALMDLGSSVCLPRTPRCDVCPLQEGCKAFMKGLAAELPRRAPKAEKPVRYGVIFWIEDTRGRVLLRRRPEKGLLGGMYEIPSTDWGDKPFDAFDPEPVVEGLDWTEHAGEIRHTFTHFHLRLKLWSATAGIRKPQEGVFVSFQDLANYALPSVMQKVIRHRFEKERKTAA